MVEMIIWCVAIYCGLSVFMVVCSVIGTLWELVTGWGQGYAEIHGIKKSREADK